ncbi:endogenous retrovirus group K member 19 Env polyprotein-like isoform X2 [Peromyscus leucopus]|uniref:endogenous retrovirus group K member 19 Env polyprotein-like isoform X2 n=1 Tax=Peromyscus leucopus TaxID=10041 RepID=UPI0010A13FED|nr:endogenous retrovirus group K member 19 Env polyprotein-like isoform X2 [Peromyscus leucopus]XP_037054159.1 endogenous retrovirus group K member 19 Env polyprotein-like isoform X2 [Peromyscus leucopus]
MPIPLSGSRIALSDLQREKRRRKRHRRKQQRKLLTEMQKMKLGGGEKPKVTWSQIQLLTRNAKKLLIEQEKPLTASFYFTALLSLLFAPLPVAQGVSFWAYVPNPPIIQPVGWLDREPIKVLTNDSVRLGGAQDSDARSSSSSLINFEGRADSLPICLTLQGKVPYGCFPTSYRTFLTDGPDKANAGRRWVWELQIQTLGDKLYRDNFTQVNTIPITPCIQKYRDKDQFWDSSLSKFPAWLTCGFPNAAAWYEPRGRWMCLKFGTTLILMTKERLIKIT